MAQQTIDLPVAGTPIGVADFGAKVKNNFEDHETRVLAAEASITTLEATGLHLIEEQVLASPAATVTFDSIPATYRSLRLIGTARSATSGGSDQININFNDDSTADHYKIQSISAFGSTLGTIDLSTTYMYGGVAVGNGGPANSFGSIDLLIPNYANTNFNKTAIITLGGHISTGSDPMSMGHTFGAWLSTTAITKIVLDLQAADGSFMANSIFSLYGIV